MIDTYEAIKDLIDEQLNANSNGIVFDTTLYQTSKASNYIKETNQSDGVTVLKQKVVPAHIVEIVGDYINVPDTEVTQLDIAIEYDLFMRNYLSLPYLKQELYKSCDYTFTMNAISQMKRNLLAKRFPLGNVGLMFGGTDSNASFSYSSGFVHNTIYLKLDLLNNDDEEIIKIFSGTNNITVSKNSTKIQAQINNGGVVSTVLTDYSLGINEVWLFYDSSNQWNLKVGTENNTVTQAVTQSTLDEVELSIDDTFNGVFYEVLLDEGIITLDDTEKTPDEAISSPNVYLKDFTTRYELNQEGTYELLTNEVSNCITWGDLGNIVFGFETLVPIDNVKYQDNGYPRQMFGMIIKALLSKDILFGNSTEYFIRKNVGETDDDYTQIFPIDRSHTYGTELGTAQYINDAYAKTIVEESGKDLTNTFFVRPSRRIQQLLKQTTGNSESQNEVYKLKVQYPFHLEEYDVIVDSGGTNPNTNTLQSLTVTYKQADDILV